MIDYIALFDTHTPMSKAFCAKLMAPDLEAAFVLSREMQNVSRRSWGEFFLVMLVSAIDAKNVFISEGVSLFDKAEKTTFNLGESLS